MKFLELMATLGLWPFDGEVCDVERPEDRPNGDGSPAQRAIRLPGDMHIAVQAKWPSGLDRRILH